MASASGVDREPGLTTKRSTPQRASSSTTMVAQAAFAVGSDRGSARRQSAQSGANAADGPAAIASSPKRTSSQDAVSSSPA